MRKSPHRKRFIEEGRTEIGKKKKKSVMLISYRDIRRAM